MKQKYFIFFLLIFYLFFQLSTLDYGSKINDLKYFKSITLNQNDIKSFIEAKEIRHPIVERINKDIPYVTNDIELGKYSKLEFIAFLREAKNLYSILSSINIDLTKLKKYIPIKIRTNTFITMTTHI